MRDNKIILEICCGGFEDALAAKRGGADRIELNSALFLGGLTPAMGTMRRVREELGICTVAMVRPRGGGFCYTEEERKTMFEEARALLEAGADGLAFGFLNEDGTIAKTCTEEMTALIHSYEKTAVFHRAVDCTPELSKSLETLIDAGVDRVLTSGGRNTAPEGAEILAGLVGNYGKKIEILAGSGVNSRTVESLIQETGVRQVHSSCRDWRKDVTTKGSHVSYAYAPAPHEEEYEFVSEKLVRELSKTVELCQGAQGVKGKARNC